MNQYYNYPSNKNFTYICKDINEYRQLKEEEWHGWYVILGFIILVLLLVKWIVK